MHVFKNSKHILRTQQPQTRFVVIIYGHFWSTDVRFMEEVIYVSGVSLVAICNRLKCVFTARSYANVVLAIVMCLSVCLSIRPPICLSQAGIVSKQLEIVSRKQSHTIAQGLNILTPKIMIKFKRGYPQLGHQMQVG